LAGNGGAGGSAGLIRRHHVQASVNGRLALLAGAVALIGVAMPAAAQFRPGQEGFADLAERLQPAVVNISTTQKVKAPQRGQGQGPEMPQFPPGSPFEEFFKEFFDRNRGGNNGGGARKVQSLGSGFIVDAKGLVVTNNHVISEADEITVIMHDGTKLDATVKGRDQKTDLALLQVKTSKDLPTLTWGDSDKTRVGDWVLAIGNPLGLGGTVTAGIVSARNRNIDAGPYDDFIQTDASINKGNSGGPLFNMKGEVVGINTAIYSPSGGSIGIGFSIPANLAKNVVAQLREFGKTQRGWLGVRIQSVTEELAESLGLKEAKGALVAGVSPEGPAAKAGIEAGDVIVKFDGRDINEMRSLPRQVAETRVGAAVEVQVLRKGKTQKFNVKLGELEESEQQASAQTDKPSQAKAVDALGMSLSRLTPDMREKFELKGDVKGVVVTDVEQGSEAAEKGLRAGTVILEVDQEEVNSPADVSKKIKEAQDKKKKSVLLFVQRRGGDRNFVPLRFKG
jgi:serine protease Do